MKIVKTFILFSLGIFLSSFVYAFNDDLKKTIDPVEIPPGMEIIKQGDVNILVPKGGIIHKNGNMVIMESPDEYSARGFEERDNRLNEMQADFVQQKKDLEEILEGQNKEIDHLRKTVRMLQRQNNQARRAKDAEEVYIKSQRASENLSLNESSDDRAQLRRPDQKNEEATGTKPAVATPSPSGLAVRVREEDPALGQGKE